MTAPRKRGFAAMNREQQRAIASKGGRAAHRKGTAHEFSSEEARKAGYLGGKAVSANREHMAAIGRKGGQRASRGLDAQRNSQPSERHSINSDTPATPPLKDYPPHVGETPAVVLPHWREVPPELPSPPEGSPHGEEASKEEASAHKQVLPQEPTLPEPQAIPPLPEESDPAVMPHSPVKE